MNVAVLNEELTKRGLDTISDKADLRLDQDLGGPPPPKKAKTTAKEDPAKKNDRRGTDEIIVNKAVVRELTNARHTKQKRMVDSYVPDADWCLVFEDWDCMLINHSNNFCLIQLLEDKSPLASCKYGVFTRWGRVNEPGQNDLKWCLDLQEAKQLFSETNISWKNKEDFTPVPDKYNLLEMNHHNYENEEEMHSKLAVLDEADVQAPVVKPRGLDKPTQDLIKLIFSKTMFDHVLKSFKINIKKISFGELSRTQIAEGFGVLEAIESGIKANASSYELSLLTRRFYDVFPHTFPKSDPKPHVIVDLQALQEKYDMLLVLRDIETAQELLQEITKKKQSVLRYKYESLKADLVHVEKTSAEYIVLEKYLSVTAPQWRKLEILDVWKVDRDGASDRFKSHDAISNRRLLWHGTNVAAVVAILKSGLRIMPHSGGLMGKGIYFASECSKSAGYVRTSSKGFGIMFLVEVALGKAHHTMLDDPTLMQPPSGFDSVITQGLTEPDPKDDISIVLEGKIVTVSQGKPIPFSESLCKGCFPQSEYVVYKESQARIRYLLKLKFS